MSTEAVTPKFRVSYPSVFKPKLNDLNGKNEFSLVALFPKGADLTKLKKAILAAQEKKWGKDPKKWPKKMKTPFRDQSDRAKENEQGKMVMPDGYVEGAIYCNLKSDKRPSVVDENVQPILDETKFYAGCYAIAAVNAYAYDIKGNTGVALGLNHVQFAGHGEPFGNRSKAEDVFAPLEIASEGASDGDAADSLYD